VERAGLAAVGREDARRAAAVLEPLRLGAREPGRAAGLQDGADDRRHGGAGRRRGRWRVHGARGEHNWVGGQATRRGRGTVQGWWGGAERVSAEHIVGTFRRCLGPDVGIALDVAFRFKLGGAIKLAQALEPYELMWLETETFDAKALRLIRESTKTTICTGES